MDGETVTVTVGMVANGLKDFWAVLDGQDAVYSPLDQIAPGLWEYVYHYDNSQTVAESHTHESGDA